MYIDLKEKLRGNIFLINLNINNFANDIGILFYNTTIIVSAIKKTLIIYSTKY